MNPNYCQDVLEHMEDVVDETEICGLVLHTHGILGDGWNATRTDIPLGNVCQENLCLCHVMHFL